MGLLAGHESGEESMDSHPSARLPAPAVKSSFSTSLDLPPSCIEFCPAHPSFFLVGTYNLPKEETSPDAVDAVAGQGSESKEEDDGDHDNAPATSAKPQNRNGSVLVFELRDGAISLVQTTPRPSALLDLHFNPTEGHRDVCAVVSSTATLAMFRLTPGTDNPLVHLKTMDLAELSQGHVEDTEGVLFLSLCWHPSRADILAVTASNGHAYLIRVGDFEGDWVLDPEPVLTHSLESWTVAISPSLDPAGLQEAAGFTVYSGGDDSTLRYRKCTYSALLDRSEEEALLDKPYPSIKSGGHDAGVTAILPLSFAGSDGRELVVTGSYDEYIRLFSVAPDGCGPRPKLLAQMGLGGGVWRLKTIEVCKDPDQAGIWRLRLLASCMHAGARVVELCKMGDNEYGFGVLGRFEEHQSMNYGSDVLPTWRDKLAVVSTSFYDKLLCFWELELD